jgi:hypothetical protein
MLELRILLTPDVRAYKAARTQQAEAPPNVYTPDSSNSAGDL